MDMDLEYSRFMAELVSSSSLNGQPALFFALLHHDSSVCTRTLVHCIY